MKRALAVLVLFFLTVAFSLAPGCGTDEEAMRGVAPRRQPTGRDDRLAEVALEEMEDEAFQKEPRIGPQKEREGFNTEAYDEVVHNAFRMVSQHPLSTFGTDVDTASYANVRRFLRQGQLPPAGAVRVEEMINYFDYDYPQPTGEHPFSVNVELAECPWKPGRKLARIGLKGREVDTESRPDANLVFLLDVSGSMNSPNKLGLVKKSMELLVEQLKPTDRVAIAVYAGASGLVLPSTPVDAKRTILDAMARLRAGGSTNGGAGIELAYRVAGENFKDGGVNRVILCTDGDFNVGTTDQGSLIEMIEEKAEGGVFLTVLGFGMGNYKDSTLEKLADKGNGNYGYIDTEREARKVFGQQVGGTLVTIAKDVKVQVEFNPQRVQAYRLVGYENRILAAEDFNDDKKDAGDVGAGHTVTALYELVMPGEELDLPDVDELKYQTPSEPAGEHGDELMTVKLRYKQPDGDKSTLITLPVQDADTAYTEASDDFQFATAVAAFGMVLRDSPHAGTASLPLLKEWAQGAAGEDRHGHRAEFIELVDKAEELTREAK
jgi:Ca-activated chloride channel family protein